MIDGVGRGRMQKSKEAKELSTSSSPGLRAPDSTRAKYDQTPSQSSGAKRCSSRVERGEAARRDRFAASKREYGDANGRERSDVRLGWQEEGSGP
jgi:hypothetical protein